MSYTFFSYLKYLVVLLLTCSVLLFANNALAITNTQSIDLELSSSQYLTISDANQTDLDVTGDLTIEAWINPESIGTTARLIVAKYNSSSDRAYKFYIDPNGYLVGVVDEAANGTDQSSSRSSTDFDSLIGEWTHVAMTYDSSTGEVDLYVDGTNDTPSYLQTDASSINNSSGPFHIGAMGSTPVNFFDGLIDEVRIWNDVRTPSEISDNMNKSLDGTEGNLVAYWDLNNSATDKTSNDNDLTLSGSPSYSEEPANTLTCSIGGLF